MTNFKVDIVSDTVCPWCYVGAKRLQAAIKQYQASNPTDTFSTEWHAYQLNPNSPQSIDKQEFYNKRFGAARAASMYGPLQAIGSQVGINFKFGGKTGNTRDSHRLISLARTKGLETQDKVVRELHHAYFEVNDDITNVDSLIQIGTDAGLPAAEVRDWMQSGKGGAEVDADALANLRKGITGVPYFTINGKYHIQGAETPDEFVSVFNEIKESQA